MKEISPVIIIGMSKFNENEIQLIQAAKGCVLALVDLDIYGFYECLDPLVGLIPLKDIFRYMQEGYLLARRDPSLSDAQRALIDGEWFVRKATPLSYLRSARRIHDDLMPHQAA